MRPSNERYSSNLEKNKTKPRVFIGVVSAPHHFDKRKWIRETWVQSLDSSIVNATFEYGFFIGSSSNDSLIDVQVTEEGKKYDDIIHLLDVIDSYRNLTLKTLALLDWTKHYYDGDRIDFILKADDDVYVNVYNLAQVVSSISKETKAIYGFGWETEQEVIRLPGTL
jgi:hypothetical protein